MTLYIIVSPHWFFFSAAFGGHGFLPPPRIPPPLGFRKISPPLRLNMKFQNRYQTGIFSPAALFFSSPPFKHEMSKSLPNRILRIRLLPSPPPPRIHGTHGTQKKTMLSLLFPSRITHNLFLIRSLQRSGT